MAVRAANGGGRFHRLMLVQGLLDHQRIDVVAAADDQILGAARQPDEIVGIDAAEIAGVQPAPLVGIVCFSLDPRIAIVRRRDVAFENLRSPHQHHALLVGRAAAFDPIAFQFGHDQLHVGQAMADRADARRAQARVHAGEAVHFGHAEAFDDFHVQKLLHLLGQFHRHGRAAAIGKLDGRNVGSIERHVHQRAPHGRHGADHGGLETLDQSPEIAGDQRVAHAQRREQHGGAAIAHRRQSGANRAADMEQRQAVEIEIVRAGQQAVGVRHRRHHQPALRVLSQFRRTGGAAGMEQVGDIIELRVARAGRVLAVVLADLVLVAQHIGRRLATDHDDVLKRRHLGFDVGQLGPDIRHDGRIARDQDLRFGLGHDADDLRRLKIVVDRIGDARGFRTPHRKEGLRQDGYDQRHDIARAHAQRAEHIGALGDAFDELAVGIGDGLVVGRALGQEMDGRLVGVFLRRLLQQIVHIGRRDALLVGRLLELLDLGQAGERHWRIPLLCINGCS